MKNVMMVADANRPGNSTYEWFNIERLGDRIGRIRVRKSHTRLVIFSINIYDQHKGYGRAVIELFKKAYNELCADRVRNQAVGFWERMEFMDAPGGRYIWQRSATTCSNNIDNNQFNVSV